MNRLFNCTYSRSTGLVRVRRTFQIRSSPEKDISTSFDVSRPTNPSQNSPLIGRDDASMSSTDSSFQPIASSASTPVVASTALTAAPAAPASPAKRVIFARRLLVGLIFCAFILCQLDRANMSIAIIPIANALSLDSVSMGLIQSSFFWGYLCTQLLGGYLADLIGGKRVLGFGVIWWSVWTVITPFAASMGLGPLLIARAGMGLGEGVAMPAMNNVISRHIPIEERSRSLAFIYSGMYVGSVLGLFLSPKIIEGFGWPSVFTSFGALGLVWFAVWRGLAHLMDTSESAATRAKSGAEASTSAASTTRPAPEIITLSDIATYPAEARPKQVPWKAFLTEPAVWALIGAHFMHNFSYFILLTWAPIYMTKVLGLSLADCGAAAAAPWIAMAIGGNLGGSIADNLIKKGVKVIHVRKIMQTIGFMGPALFIGLLARGPGSVLEAIVFLSCAQFFDAFSQSGLYSNHQDIGPKYAGVLLGLSNTFGVLAGVICTFVTGYLLSVSGGNWTYVWTASFMASGMGCIIWNTWAKGEKLFD